MAKNTTTTTAPAAPAAPQQGAGTASGGIVNSTVENAPARDLSGQAAPGIDTQKPDALAAGRTMLAAGRPEETARATRAAAGSSVDAPSVGSGPASISDASRVPLGRIVDHFGSADPRELRRLRLFEDVRRAPIVGGKLAIALPEDADALEDCREAGFDLVITSRKASFRRAGVMHPEEATLRRSQDFTQQELVSLEKEPALIIRPL